MKRSSGKIYLISLAVILTVSLAFLPSSVLAIEYNFTTINVPGAYAWGINDRNNIVGWYNDANPATGMHGFFYAGGNFTPIDFPGAPYTSVQGINNSNDIVGSHHTSITGPDGFLYAGGSFTPINVPGASWTVPTDINNSNIIVGSYYDATYHGFLYAGGNFSPINVPGASWTAPTGINNPNNIVGTYFDGVSKHGFLYARGSFTLIDFPGAYGTEANGINDSNDVVGLYYDAAGLHGFVASRAPVPEPSTMLLLASGLIGLAGYGRKKFFKK